jgi:hypothetical protein
MAVKYRKSKSKWIAPNITDAEHIQGEKNETKADWKGTRRKKERKMKLTSKKTKKTVVQELNSKTCSDENIKTKQSTTGPVCQSKSSISLEDDVLNLLSGEKSQELKRNKCLKCYKLYTESTSPSALNVNVGTLVEQFRHS